MDSGFIYTNENCINCYKCVRVCTSPGASYVNATEDSSVVHINRERCISCGACFALCEHSARDYLDDTSIFFKDLESGEPITLLISPAFPALYPDEYEAVLGGLKDRGVRRIISVSLGADICTWAYLKYIRNNSFYGGISTPCPVVVSYIEHYLPELIPRLIPVHSPMVCAAIYCREVLGITDRIAFIGPCIGKKMETDSYYDSPVHYNVTFLKLMEYVRRDRIYGPNVSDEIEYGLGSFYPMPGGLTENIRWFLGEDVSVRCVSGKTYLYEWLRKSVWKLKNQQPPFFMVDVLNCREGCLEGTASEAGRFEEDRSIYTIQRIKAKIKNNLPQSPWNPSLSVEERLNCLNEQFKDLSIDHYLRSFVDRSKGNELKIPMKDEAERIFNDMYKTTSKTRTINCSACGYNTCYDMMIAIYNGFNTKHSCIHYEKHEAIRIERLSMQDYLTGVMNRSGLQHFISNLYRDKALAVIAVDINGLKVTNDTYGHEAGDLLIKETAYGLSMMFGEKSVFRTGGDEFIVIKQDYTEDECMESLRQFVLYMKEKEISAAIGYTYNACCDKSFSEIQAVADKLMYEDKERYYQEIGRVRRK